MRGMAVNQEERRLTSSSLTSVGRNHSVKISPPSIHCWSWAH